jgi:hypothetical protein
MLLRVAGLRSGYTLDLVVYPWVADGKETGRTLVTPVKNNLAPRQTGCKRRAEKMAEVLYVYRQVKILKKAAASSKKMPPPRPRRANTKRIYVLCVSIVFQSTGWVR